MKFTTSAVVLAAALGVTAHPSAHGHKHAHRSIEARNNFVMANKPAPPPPPPPSTTKEAPKPTQEAPKPKAQKQQQEQKPKAEAPKPSSSPSSGSGSSGSGSSGSPKSFCDGVKYTKYYDNKKRATMADIMYKGNIGAPGNYGCNMMMVDGPDGYDHITKFYNAASKEQECACFNKVGPVNDEINGFFDGKEALKFKIGAGETKYLAADDNTQGGCSCGVGSVPLTDFGEFAATWLEFDFKSSINDGWSGADASCLVSSALGLDIPGMSVCGHDECSIIYPGGDGKNAYLKGMEDLDGIGLNIYPGEVRLNVIIGYTGKE